MKRRLLLAPLALAPLFAPATPAPDNVSLGKAIFDDTPKHAAAWVGNVLSCKNCHLQSGTAAHASPLAGVPGLFPMYSKRAGRVITFRERVQECFVRSENGLLLPASSPEMNALVAYIESLSKGGKPGPGRGLVKLPQLEGNPERGKALYAVQCAACHGAGGQGAPPFFPPLWGPRAFNDGAGISKVEKMAAFVQHNMPMNGAGTLSPQQAYDVAAYVCAKPHPKFNPQYAKY